VNTWSGHSENEPDPVFTKPFRFRIKIRLTFQNEYFLDYFPLSVKENLIVVYIDMVNIVIGFSIAVKIGNAVCIMLCALKQPVTV